MINKVIFMLDKLPQQYCGLNKGTYTILRYLFNVIRFTIPVLLLVLIAKDFVTATMAGKEEDIKKAQKDALTRIIIGVILFLLPSIVNIIMSIIGNTTCKITNF